MSLLSNPEIARKIKINMYITPTLRSLKFFEENGILQKFKMETPNY